MTLPKGKPSAMTSVSEASLGSFLMWSTRDGGASSTLNFLLSLPLEAPSKTLAQTLINCAHQLNGTPLSLKDEAGDILYFCYRQHIS